MDWSGFEGKDSMTVHELLAHFDGSNLRNGRARDCRAEGDDTPAEDAWGTSL